MELLSTAASWLTPTTLFLLLNIMIGTIAVTSRFGSGSRKQHDGFGSGHAHTQAPLARAPSIIDRVKSINFHLYKFPHQENELFSMTAHHDVVGSDLHVYPDQAPLQRAPSLLERVKSIDMSYFNFLHESTGSDHHSYSHPDPHPAPTPAPLQRAPSLLDRVKSINMSYFKFQQYNPEENHGSHHTETTRFENIPSRMGQVNPIDISKFKIPEEDQPTGPGYEHPINPPVLTRAPSMLERVKSIKLSSFYRSDPETHLDQNPDPNSIFPEDHKHIRSKSESKKPVKKKKKATAKMTKSASEKSGFGYTGSQEGAAETVESVERRRPDTTRVEKSTTLGDGEECVDTKASDFINKFKEQLKLQRLDSIMRYKEMLKTN